MRWILWFPACSIMVIGIIRLSEPLVAIAYFTLAITLVVMAIFIILIEDKPHG